MLLGALALIQTVAKAQSLLDEISNDASKTILTENTFKGTRLINGHTVETRKAKTLEFIIAHRFGLISSGAYELWGLDASNIRLGLEYGLTDKLYIGVGRSSFEKTFDGFAKYRIIQQQTGKKSIPISVTAFGSAAIVTQRADRYQNLTDRMVYTSQLLIARKFSPDFSLQIAPTFVHHNMIRLNAQRNSSFALGVGGRYKLNTRFSINAEYFIQVSEIDESTYNALAIGVDIETGGHVFQLQFTNSRAMIEKGFINETRSDFFAGDIHFGFNISRTF